jgi:hypothetical protein
MSKGVDPPELVLRPETEREREREGKREGGKERGRERKRGVSSASSGTEFIEK